MIPDIFYISIFRSVSSGSLELNQQTSNKSEKSTTGTYHDREPRKQRGRSHKKSSLPPGIRKLPSPPTTLEQAQMEWDMVETVQPGTQCHRPLNSIKFL